MKITLEKAIDLALKNNTSIKNERLLNEYRNKISGSGFDIPKTNVALEYGQFNSVYNDKKFSIAQSINFPTVYARQRRVLKENYQSGLLELNLREAELKKQVSETFFLLVNMNEKQFILTEMDSIYSGFLSRAEFRYSKGETNALEMITASSQKAQIRMQLSQLLLDKENELMKFQLLLNSNDKLIPEPSNQLLEAPVSRDTTVAPSHPLVKILEKQKQISLASEKLERSRLMPDLVVGYNLMSIKGTGPDNIYYDDETRFGSVQIGVGIPLFFGAQRSKIKAARFMTTIAANSYESGVKNFKNQLVSAFRQLDVSRERLSYYQNDGFKNAGRVVEIANAQFTNGEINYLEWTMLMNNATVLRTGYADAVYELNSAIIEINYLTTK